VRRRERDGDLVGGGARQVVERAALDLADRERAEAVDDGVAVAAIDSSQPSPIARRRKTTMAANVDSGGACEAASMLLLTNRSTQARICCRMLRSWYSGCTSSRRSSDLASSGDGSRGGSATSARRTLTTR
jgi:hypothetical protein